ncbi:relaxin receptor 1-like [Penaeus japonicus]|uniref:relaxin receptor 1-like n=1 Tax=Penaeus japonicus TaxID=27405 RepID=UPI001C70B81C|nr:relaxin receptor 1-like [Penaeus japonicus]
MIPATQTHLSAASLWRERKGVERKRKNAESLIPRGHSPLPTALMATLGKGIRFLEQNEVEILSKDSLVGLSGLTSLHLQEMELSEDLLVNLSHYRSSSLTSGDPSDSGVTWPNITHLYFKRFRYCSYFPWIPDCRPKTDGVSSFENLLIRRELRVAVWLVAILTLLGNLTVLAGRLLTRDDNKLLSLFIRNLAVSDLLTGVYLVIVGVKDLQFRSVYHENAHAWMTSSGCAVTGVLAMTSAEVSVLVLAFMSVERLVCITRPLRSPGLSLATARLGLSALWLCGLTLAIAPQLYYQGTPRGFYGTNGLCFPLHLDDPWVPGWPFAALVLVGINQVGVLVILLSYLGMFVSIRTTRASTPLSLGDREFAIRFFFIVVTDCLCWIPIIVLKYLAMMGLDIHPKLYAYVVVVLLPINSALNPFLYTFTTSKFRSRASHLCSTKALCHKTHAVDTDSEATRTSLLRGATCRGAVGREGTPLQNHFIVVEHLVGGEDGEGGAKTTRV